MAKKVKQSDLKENSGLVDVMRRVETVPGIGIIRFTRESIVRHPLVSAVLERFEE